MDIYALGQACNDYRSIADERIRRRDPVAVWLHQYRHDGLFELSLYSARVDGGYLSQGSTHLINWIPGDGVYHGYPRERQGGALNHRYDVPMDAYLPNAQYEG